jgi:cyclophilin family peptidyl-prolyl cis-trans isomerase
MISKVVLMAACTALLTACGGALSWDPDPVTGITATNLRLGQTATLHLTGNALNNAISITSDKCSAINPGFDYVSTQPGYAVFGTVVSGTDTIDKIAAQPTHDVTTYGAGNVANTFHNVPVTDITITSTTQTQ